jgi:hypothetical protein
VVEPLGVSWAARVPPCTGEVTTTSPVLQVQPLKFPVSKPGLTTRFPGVGVGVTTGVGVVPGVGVGVGVRVGVGVGVGVLVGVGVIPGVGVGVRVGVGVGVGVLVGVGVIPGVGVGLVPSLFPVRPLATALIRVPVESSPSREKTIAPANPLVLI